MLQKSRNRTYTHQVLKSLYGINKCTANKIIGLLGLHPQGARKHLLSAYKRDVLHMILAPLRIDFKLRLIVFSRILLQCFLKTYRGYRHIQGLPCRGQRTHANAKTPARLRLQGKNIPFKFRFFKKHFQADLSKKKKPIKTKIKAKAKKGEKVKKKKKEK